MMNSEGRHLAMVWLRLLLRTKFSTMDLSWYLPTQLMVVINSLILGPRMSAISFLVENWGRCATYFWTARSNSWMLPYSNMRSSLNSSQSMTE